jgi:hypothetical protein
MCRLSHFPQIGAVTNADSTQRAVDPLPRAAYKSHKVAPLQDEFGRKEFVKMGGNQPA